eukprot:scaffold57175_cov63-Phaeocystis_antarctica.AAC.4
MGAAGVSLAGATGAACYWLFGRLRALAAWLHPCDPLVPALDDVACAKLELDRLATGQGRVEDLAVLELSRVVHSHSHTSRRHLARTNRVVAVLETARAHDKLSSGGAALAQRPALRG